MSHVDKVMRRPHRPWRIVLAALGVLCCLLLVAGVGVGTHVGDGDAAVDDAADIVAGESQDAASSNADTASDAVDASDVSTSTAGGGADTTATPSPTGTMYSSLNLDDVAGVSADDEGSAYVAGELLVLFAAGVDAATAASELEALGLSADADELVACLDASSLVEAQVTDGSSVAAALQRVQAQASDAVAYAQPNYLYSAVDADAESDAGAGVAGVADIDDPYASSQWHLDAINAYDAWDIQTVSGDVAVAVIDTGVDRRHEDLADRIVTGYSAVDFTNNYDDVDGHGTHVAGIVAATTDNAIGTSGVSYNASLIPIRAAYVERGTVTITSRTLTEAYSYLLVDADSNGTSDLVERYNLHVVNISIGTTASVSGDDALFTAIDKAYEQGILTVCAGGNEGVESVDDSNAFWPADYETCMSVIALDDDLSLASYSNYGDAKDIAAPGSDILSTAYGNSYALKSGTSMASPVVAGVAALVFAHYDGITAQGVRGILETTAQDLGETGWDSQTAWGCVDAAAALQAVFSDVRSGQWYTDAIYYLNELGFMTGYADGSMRFGVGATMTRAQMASVIWRIAEPEEAAFVASDMDAVNETGMDDVADGAWYTAAANWAVANGVINGFLNADGSHSFKPNDALTFEQCCVILANYIEAQGAAEADVSVLAAFTDGSSVSSWARTSVSWAVETGLVNGYAHSDGSRSLKPKEGLKRERAATLLAQALESGALSG